MAILTESIEWSSHSPDRVPPPRSRASCPSLASSAYPSTKAPVTSSAVGTPGFRAASATMLPKVKTAPIAVTWFGVRPTWWAAAAKTRPSGRLITNE